MCAAVIDDDVTLGGVPLSRLRARRGPPPDRGVRHRQPRCSPVGSCDRLDVTGGGGVDQALATASGDDILEALPEGLDTDVSERGRSFSGGQRQRLVLARALTIDPEILVLVEPTSAVDAHTEARIAARLRAHRAGRTTVVTSSSPLVLDAVDEVAFLARRPGRRDRNAQRPAGQQPRLPRRRHPRGRARPAARAEMEVVR